MSQDKDLSSLTPVVSGPGKYQWVKGKVTGIDDEQKERTRIRRLRWIASVALALGLGACAQSGSPPKVRSAVPAKPRVPPQVAYRIDDHRYFEITPEANCYGDMLYFIDTVKGIRSEVVAFDAVMNRTTLIIDAANDQYLVAPVTRGGTNCSSGGGGCGERLPYSTDGGKTWRRAWYPGYGDDLMIGGSTAYRSYRIQTVHTDRLDLSDLPTPRDTNWKSIRDFVFKPRVAPVDTKVQCKAQDIGSRK
jgi:hypothetical protein